MVDYIYRCGPSVLSFGKSVQSYENFLIYANKTQKIAVICVFLIISPIFMSSFVHYLCPPLSIIYVLLRPLVGQFYCPLSIRLSVYVLLRLSFGISFFCIRHAWRIGNAAFCIVFSFSPSLKGRVGVCFRPLCRLRAGFFFHYSFSLSFIFLVTIVILLLYYCSFIGWLLGDYWVIIG